MAYRRRRLALRREQAGGRGEVSGAADQDGHDALHPVHALRALHDRGGGRRGARRHRPRRGHGDHHLPRARHDVGAVRQRRRPVPGRRAHAPALGVHAARPWELRKTESIDVMDAVGSRDPRRHARPRGGAHPAAQQRRRERGMDFRQDASCGRRAAHPAPRRPYVRKNGRLEPVGLGRGAGARRRKAEGGEARADRRHRRRSRRCRGDVRAARSARAAWARATSTAGRTAPSSTRRLGRASYLFNTSIEGIEQADAILLVGTNPRLEAAVLNARIRKRWRQGGAAIGLIGEQRRPDLSLRVSRRRRRRR